MHTIQLRHPWQCEAVGEGSRWTRKFNWPADLAESETAWIVIEGEAWSSQPLLNDKPLADSSGPRYDVTALLAKHNRLTLSHAAKPPSDQRDCPFEVRLEIVSG